MNKTRLGLIEIGSRAVRYLVMDIHERVQDLQSVKITTVQHGVDPTFIDGADVRAINELVAQLKRDLPQHGCDIECVYGTELCRAIQAQRPGELSDKIRVLSVGEEASAAWAAAFLCQDAEEESDPLTVIDLGNGSTQLARGRWTGSKIVDLRTTSVSVGSALLMNRYIRDPAGFAAFVAAQAALVEKSARVADIVREREGSVYLMGGVATKFGWLTVRSRMSEVYRPERVNGVSVPLNIFDQFFTTMGAAYRRTPDQVARSIDEREGSEDEALRVISGTAYFSSLVRSVHHTTAPRISGWGLRHGMAFLLLHELLNV
jgi:exopolyphosphatase/pppGpp-phosphohydrolase